MGRGRIICRQQVSYLRIKGKLKTLVLEHPDYRKEEKDKEQQEIQKELEKIEKKRDNLERLSYKV